MVSNRVTILGIAFALAAAGLVAFDCRDGDAVAAPALAPASQDTALFYNPRIDGISLDVRMMAHMRADPVQTAERFCRAQGYSRVADVTIRPSLATRTIADGSIHDNPGEARQAFAMINCATQDAPTS